MSEMSLVADAIAYSFGFIVGAFIIGAVMGNYLPLRKSKPVAPQEQDKPK